MSVSCVTVLRAEFMAEMARHRISPSGMNWDWLMGDMLMGDTSPAKDKGQRFTQCSRGERLKVYSVGFNAEQVS